MSWDLGMISSKPYAFEDIRGYKALELDQRISLADALDKVGLTYDEACKFNFGPLPSGIPDYDAYFGFPDVSSHMMWERDSGGIPGLSGWMGSRIWVPGNCKIKPPNADGAVFKDHTKGKAEKDTEKGIDVPPLTSGKQYYAARSQGDGIWATSTVDTGFQAGDILLSHHSHDAFICRATISWPTHAGMAINEMWAVDADQRPEGHAVLPVRLKHFFIQKEHHSYWDTPHGGLVYRYIGKPGDKKEDIEKVRHDAAVWAKKEAWNKYAFVLTSSHIVTKKIGEIKKREVIDKKFDAVGKAVDKDGKRPTYYSKSEDKEKESESHAIYCAEFVWRAYKFGAGINIVDPKKLTNLFKDSSHAIAELVGNKIIEERAAASYARDANGNPESKTAEKLRKALSGLGAIARGLPAFLVRQEILKKMRKEFNAYLCAPYQLAQSNLTECVAQLPPLDKLDADSKPLYKHVEITDFRKKKFHPYKLLMALSEGDNKVDFEKGWNKFVKKYGKPTRLTFKKPWAGAKAEPDAPELKLDSKDNAKPFNTDVDFSAATNKPPFLT
jgi:signal peptidase I